MKKEESKPKIKQPYVEPKVIATYDKEELEETLAPEGSIPFPSPDAGTPNQTGSVPG